MGQAPSARGAGSVCSPSRESPFMHVTVESGIITQILDFPYKPVSKAGVPRSRLACGRCRRSQCAVAAVFAGLEQARVKTCTSTKAGHESVAQFLGAPAIVSPSLRQ